jgi:hypothetical protein
MTMDSPATKATSGRALIPISIILLIIGATGIVLYAVGAPDHLAGGSALGVLRAGVIIVSALCVGLGASLGLLALLRRRRRAADGSNGVP